MKARVKATGEIIEIKYSRQIGPDAMYKDLKTGKFYADFELSILPEDGTPDYWTRLEHQAAIAAMQGMCANPQYPDNSWDAMATDAAKAAHALVEKYKEKEV